MSEIKVIDIRKSILLDNDIEAEKLRRRLLEKKVFLVNLMASPGAGKTSLLIRTIRRLSGEFRVGVIEGDIDSTVDARKISAEGVAAVQIQTGGACHLDASMVRQGINRLDLESLDLVFVENIGNLVCPAEFDIGADVRVMILSVPEGDDKPLKYPLMFSVCDALVINKTDYLPDEGFDLKLVQTRARRLNPAVACFPVSCRKETGLEAWCGWLKAKVLEKTKK